MFDDCIQIDLTNRTKVSVLSALIHRYPSMRKLLFILPLLLAACGNDSGNTTASGECEETPGIEYQTDGQISFMRADSSVVTSASFEVADNDSTRSRGLMDRKCLPDNWGMVFVFPEERSQAFYMANTPRSLDIMYFAGDSTFVSAAKYTTPFSTDNLVSDGPAQFVVEMPAGFVDRHGIALGDRIDWTLQ